MKYPFVMPILGALFLLLPRAVIAQEEVSLLSPGSAQAGIAALFPGFENKSGLKVKASFGTGADVRKQATDEATDFDVKILQPPLDDILAKANVVASSQTLIPGVLIGVIVKTGTPRPDVSTADAVKKALLAAKSVSFPDPAGPSASGPSVRDTLTKLGILAEVQAKSKYAMGDGSVVRNVLGGDAEIGIAFLSVASQPGIDVLGPLPADISPPTHLVAFVSSRAKNPAGAQALLQYLASPAATDAYRAHGMLPPH